MRNVCWYRCVQGVRQYFFCTDSLARRLMLPGYDETQSFLPLVSERSFRLIWL